MGLKMSLLPILLVFPYGAFASVTWPNEPAGSHFYLDCPFNSLGECGLKDNYSSAQITSDATAPVSPNSVMKSNLSAGATSGGVEVHYYAPQMNRELFVGLMWRTNPQFQGRSGGNKLFFVRGPNTNGVFVIQGGLSSGNGPLVWSANTGGLDNSHACSGDAVGSLCYPNGGNGTLQRGVWTKIEAYIKASTTATSRDGIVRWWVDGVLAGNYTSLNYPGPLREWVWSETWDGCGGNANCDLGRVNTVEWAHFVDHLYVSAPNFVLSVPKITNDTIPSLAQSGKSYTAYLKASAEYVPLNWTISSGSLPGGLTLGEKTGVITGAPNTCGIHNFTVKLTDANQSVATKSFSLNVAGTCTGTLVQADLPSNGNESFSVRSVAGAAIFNLSQPGQYQISVYDLSGKRVYACSGLGQKKIEIKTALKNGVYLARAVKGAQASVFRFKVIN